jgi:hypothetical protein
VGSSGSNGTKGGATAGVLLAGAVSLLALPSAVLAFSTDFSPELATAPSGETIKTLQGGDASSDLARPIPIRSLAKGRLYLFTPAKTPNRPDRSVTVAVRVDPWAAKGISVLGRKDTPVIVANPLRIAPNAFNLGVQRGYHNFAQNLVPQAEGRKSDTPDLSSRFSLAPRAKGDDSRFSPRIAFDEKQAAGRAPRTFAGDREDQVDVGGAYRVTRNLDVTAGVRYSQERDRLVPLTTDGRQDNQAVYVGTQFRF